MDIHSDQTNYQLQVDSSLTMSEDAKVDSKPDINLFLERLKPESKSSKKKGSGAYRRKVTNLRQRGYTTAEAKTLAHQTADDLRKNGVAYGRIKKLKRLGWRDDQIWKGDKAKQRLKQSVSTSDNSGQYNQSESSKLNNQSQSSGLFSQSGSSEDYRLDNQNGSAREKQEVILEPEKSKEVSMTLAGASDMGRGNSFGVSSQPSKAPLPSLKESKLLYLKTKYGDKFQPALASKFMTKQTNVCYNKLAQSMDDDSLKLAIVPNVYPLIKFNDVSKMSRIKHILNETIDALPKGVMTPKFSSIYLAKGSVVMICENSYSKDWLKSTVPTLDLLYDNNGKVIILKTLEMHQLQGYKKVQAWIPGPPVSNDIILNRLAKQNVGLDTSGWRIYQRDVIDKKVKLIISMDLHSWEVIEGYRWKLCCGTDQAEFILCEFNNLVKTRKGPNFYEEKQMKQDVWRDESYEAVRPQHEHTLYQNTYVQSMVDPKTPTDYIPQRPSYSKAEEETENLLNELERTWNSPKKIENDPDRVLEESEDLEKGHWSGRNNSIFSFDSVSRGWTDKEKEGWPVRKEESRNIERDRLDGRFSFDSISREWTDKEKEDWPVRKEESRNIERERLDGRFSFGSVSRVWTDKEKEDWPVRKEESRNIERDRLDGRDYQRYRVDCNDRREDWNDKREDLNDRREDWKGRREHFSDRSDDWNDRSDDWNDRRKDFNDRRDFNDWNDRQEDRKGRREDLYNRRKEWEYRREGWQDKRYD